MGHCTQIPNHSLRANIITLGKKYCFFSLVFSCNFHLFDFLFSDNHVILKRNIYINDEINNEIHCYDFDF